MYCKFMCNVFEYAWIQTSKFRPRKVAETNDVEATDKLLAYHKQLLTLAKSEFSLTGLVYYYLRLWRWVGAINKLIMRPSSLGGGRILRRTLSVRLSVCPSVCPSVPLSLPSVTSFRQPLASWMYFSARTEGRISYGHLGRTDSCYYYLRIWCH